VVALQSWLDGRERGGLEAAVWGVARDSRAVCARLAACKPPRPPEDPHATDQRAMPEESGRTADDCTRSDHCASKIVQHADALRYRRRKIVHIREIRARR
jgi:hypothetical protein